MKPVPSWFSRSCGAAAAVSWAAWAAWAPFAVLAGAWTWGFLAGTLALDLWHLLLGALLAAAWLLGRGLVTPAVVSLALLTPLLLHFGHRLPEARRVLATARGEVRVEGTVRARAPLRSAGDASAAGVRLLLGDAVLWASGRRAALAVVEVRLPPPDTPWRFPHRRRVRLGGEVSGASLTSPAGTSMVAGTSQPQRQGALLRIGFRSARHHLRSDPVTAWSGEALRLRLRDRAAYYLSPPALAVYLPILLGVRERSTPEARRVGRAFRRVGIAHLFAISGLHVGLLYLLFAGGLRVLRAGFITVKQAIGWRGATGLAQGWAHTPAASRVAVTAALWGYIALIGFPLPALRAALMGTLLIWTGLWGTRTPPLYVLFLAALAILAPDPSQFHDLSFQLSFAAYFFLVCALRTWRPWPLSDQGAARGRRGMRWWGRRWARIAEGAGVSLWMTAFITAGLWPLTVPVFGRFSLLVFAGNLVMIPLLALLVLPAGLLALALSFVHLGGPPGAWDEWFAFAALERILTGWVWLVEGLDRLGGALVFTPELALSPRLAAAYYAALLLGIWALIRRKNARPGNGPAKVARA